MKDLQPIDVSVTPRARRSVSRVARTQVPLALTTDEDDLTALTPVANSPRRSRRARVITPDDPLFAIIGIGRSQIPGGVSERKRDAVGRAYRPKPSMVSTHHVDAGSDPMTRGEAFLVDDDRP